MVQCKQECLIPSIIADKAINVSKELDTITDKKLNPIVNEAVNTNKRYDAAVSK